MHDLPVDLLARLDSWRLRQFPAPSRAEVIATLVEIAMRRDEAVLNSTDGCLERLRVPRHHAHSAKLALNHLATEPAHWVVTRLLKIKSRSVPLPLAAMPSSMPCASG